jgi:hypothetical protein
MMGYGPHWGMMSYGPKWGMMSGLGGPIWAAPSSMITWPLLLVAATAGVVWFLRSSSTGSQPPPSRRISGQTS